MRPAVLAATVLWGPGRGFWGPGAGLLGPGRGFWGPGRGFWGPGWGGFWGTGRGFWGPGRGFWGPGRGFWGPGRGFQSIGCAAEISPQSTAPLSAPLSVHIPNHSPALSSQPTLRLIDRVALLQVPLPGFLRHDSRVAVLCVSLPYICSGLGQVMFWIASTSVT